MSKGQKILTTTLWAVLVVGVLTMVVTGQFVGRDRAGNAPADPGLPQPADGSTAALDTLFDVGPFSLTDQRGRTVSNESLKGKPWIGMVFFSRCPMACPRMIGRLKVLERDVPSDDLRLVGLTVDPKHDTPEALSAYAGRIGATSDRWLFLTGPADELLAAGEGSLKLVTGIEDGTRGHSEKLLLVDSVGTVRGIYDTNEDEAMRELAADARSLVGLPPLPAAAPAAPTTAAGASR